MFSAVVVTLPLLVLSPTTNFLPSFCFGERNAARRIWLRVVGDNTNNGIQDFFLLPTPLRP